MEEEHSSGSSLGLPWRLVVFGLTLFFFSNVAVHGFLFAGWPIRPAAIFGLAVFALSVFIYARSGLGFLTSSIAYWCVFFIAVTVVSFIGFGGAALPSVLGRCYAALFLLFFFAVFSIHPDAVKSARFALVVGVLLAAACNAYEIMNPTAFLPSGMFYGRAAGFYVNPNQAGAAIVLGTILGLGVVPPRLRWLFLTVSLGGIALTLSRAAVIGWFIAVAALIGTGSLRARTPLLALATVASLAYSVWVLLGEYLLRARGIDLSLLQERVGFFTAVNAIPDVSQLERQRVAEKALILFENNFWFGKGLGSTESWSESASTHNMYLYFMADHGLIGVLFYPALVILAVRGANSAARSSAIAFACFALAWGMFSHNIVGELYSLLSFALIAAWVRTNADASSARTTLASGIGGYGVA